MAVVQRNAQQAAPQEQAVKNTSFTNLIDLGDRWLVKVFVGPVQLRTLVGRKITGIAPHPKGGGRSVPTYNVDADGWLSKWFAFEVPKVAGVYDLSARAVDADADSVQIESSQVLVEDRDGTMTIRRMGYGEMVEHFGGQRLQRGADGALTEVSASAESF